MPKYKVRPHPMVGAPDAVGVFRGNDEVPAVIAADAYGARVCAAAFDQAEAIASATVAAELRALEVERLDGLRSGK